MPDGVRTVLEGSSVVAAFIYGFGWVLAARFYGKFGVSPEEVGVGFAFLLVRAVFVLVASAVVLGSIWWALRWLSERVGWLEIPASSPLKWVAVVTAVVAASLAASLVSIMSALPIIVPLLASLLTKSMADVAGRIRRINFGRVLRAISWVFGVVGVAMVLLAPFFIADRLAHQVRAGKELAVSVLPGVAGLRVQKVTATTTDAMPVTASVPNGSCVSLFGASQEVAVLYDPKTGVTSRVPVGRLSLEQPCQRVP